MPFVVVFGSDVVFTIDHLGSISFFCQNAHHDWLTKDYISNWFLVFSHIYQNKYKIANVGRHNDVINIVKPQNG